VPTPPAQSLPDRGSGGQVSTHTHRLQRTTSGAWSLSQIGSLPRVKLWAFSIYLCGDTHDDSRRRSPRIAVSKSNRYARSHPPRSRAAGFGLRTESPPYPLSRTEFAAPTCTSRSRYPRRTRSGV
jgi:hypothetical protein